MPIVAFLNLSISAFWFNIRGVVCGFANSATFTKQFSNSKKIRITDALLAEFDGNSQTAQFYQDLAWGGLMGYRDSSGNIIEFEAWKQLPQSQKTTILSTINTFRANGNKTCK